MKDDLVFLKHIAGAIQRIEEYTKGLSYQPFLTAFLTQDGVIRQIEIIGEASKRISQQTKEKYPALPWKDMVGMRDRLIHGYFGVDLLAVWNTVEKDIPFLKKEIHRILKG